MATTATTGTTFPDQKNLEKQLQRQMGCMAGFFQLFDRHHLLTGKRIYSTKRLPSPSSIADSASESGQSVRSPPEEPHPATPPRSDRSKPQLELSSMKTPPPSVSPFEIKDGTTTSRTSWKFREAPRLSLDSRATTDANGTLHRKQIRSINPSQSPGNGTCSGDEIEKQRKSTSVIARLMGLEPLTTTSFTETSSSANSPQLRRSASESRVTRDLTHISLESTINYQQKQIPAPKSMPRAKQELSARPAKSEAMRTSYRRNVSNHQQQRIYYDSADFFPEPKQSSVSVYGEIEKRLKMSGVVDGSSKDLETLKHILEALQLKGLLHSNKASIDQNFVYERVTELPIVVMKPSRPVEQPPPSYRSTKPGLILRRNNLNESPCISPQRRMRNSVSPTRSESSVKSTSSSSVQGRRQFVETHRSRNSSPEQRRVSSPVSSPKPTFRRSVESQAASSPRNRRSVVDARLKEKLPLPLSDESSSIGSDEHSKGKTLLSRCDMLLQSIADMNSTNSSEQPSPISVLDPSFYKEDESSSSSPSPIPKRSIDFKDLSIDFEDEDSSWTSSAISAADVSLSDDSDFLYVADVLRVLTCVPEESDIFPLLEKQQCKRGKDGSKTSKLNRKLIYDNVVEILNKNKLLPSWKADLHMATSTLPYVWSEFKRIREPDQPDQELLQVICGHLKKDLASNSFDPYNEVAEWVLDVERMVFKDLIGEAIGDLASSAVLFYPRRKLAF